MAELDPGHPDELVRTLRNWLREAHDSVGALPADTDPVEWAVHRFIASWSGPIRGTIQVLEECLESAVQSLATGNVAAARTEIESAQQLVRESLRDELGLYPWNEG